MITRRSGTPLARAVRIEVLAQHLKHRRAAESRAMTPVATGGLCASAGIDQMAIEQVGQIPAAIDRDTCPTPASQRSFTANSRIIIMPRKKDGTEMPINTDKGDCLVRKPILTRRRNHTGQNSKQGTQGECGACKDQRCVEPLKNLINHGPVERERATEISGQHVAKPDKITLYHRLIEPEVAVQFLDILGRRVGP